jgi:hypothetical protein
MANEQYSELCDYLKKRQTQLWEELNAVLIKCVLIQKKDKKKDTDSTSKGVSRVHLAHYLGQHLSSLLMVHRSKRN